MVVRPAAILLLACAASLLVACGGDSVFAPGDAVAQLAVPEPTVVAQSDSEIAITWSAVSGATHYKLYRSETSGGMYIQIGGEISVTRYLNDGLSANTSYYYQLEACSGDECSGRSPEVSATTAPPPPPLTPPAPAAPTATAQSDSEIAITWSAVSGATHYKLYRSTTSGGSYSQIGGNIAATGYRDSGLSVKTAYYYQLEACNSGGCSGRSPEVSTETSDSLDAVRDEEPIAVPEPTATAQSASEISLSWSAVADATHYKLYRSAAGVGSFEQIGGDIIGATDYVDNNGLTANTSYDYELEACNSNGCSGRSAAVSATTALGRPTSGLSATAQSASEISISWSAVAGATHYKLYRSETGAGSFEQIGGDIIGATDYVDNNGLTANTSYDYELEACNSNGCSGRSAAVSATTALGRPTSGLSATAQSASEISISWSAVAGATHYKLYWSETGAGSFEQIGGDIGETAYGDSGLDANTSYDYELEACNGNGCSGRSAAFSATTALGAPTSGLSATAQSASEISLSWSAVADATHYKLYRSAAGVGSFDQIGDDIIGATDYVDDDGLEANTSYDYELEACNGNGCSGRSAAFSATTALGAPTSGLSATAQSASEISISWSAVADATHYKLYRSAAGVGSFDQIGGDIGETAYGDSGLDANTSYEYELESCNGNGCSGRSAAVSATTALGRPTAGLTATTQSASEISLSWSAVVDATHYKLYRSAAGAGSFDQIGGDIGATLHVDSGLDANTSYEYELEACNDNGCSARSAAFSATTALGRPTSGLTATTQSASEISLSWSAVVDATHYKLYRSDADAGSFEQVGDDIGETDYVDNNGLDANTSYDYKLEACNNNGCSGRSAAFSATTALGMPTAGLSATAQSASEISLSWSAVADATHYKLYRSETGVGSFDQIGDDIIGATDYVDDDGLEANTSYDYELEACNGNGCSARSAAFSATTALGRPTAGLTATAQSASEVSISWSAVAGATHYKLYRSDADAGSFEQVGDDIGETDYVDNNGLEANTSYDYELEACNDNGCSARSAAFSATTALGAPTAGLTATAQSTSEISLSWSAVADATHYKLYRSATGAGSFDQIGGDIGATLHVDSGLDANTSYEYELESCNGNGCSGRSAAVSATTALGRPTAGLTATTQSASEISLSWSAVADATHYKLYRSATGVGSFDQIGGEIGATDYVDDNGLEANTSYDYELEACNGNGCSARSAAFSATTALGRPISGLSATAQSASEISLSWSAVADATHYKLYRSAAGVGVFARIGDDIIGATDYVDDDGLEANTSYDYELEACNGNGCSARSAAFSATTALGMPTTGLSATAQSASEISLSWSAVADATHYKLYRSAGVGSFDQIGGEIVETAYGDSGLDANTSYDYELEACNGNGCSARSAAFSATTALGAPTSGLSATTQSASEISISWSAVVDATHYKLYRSAAGVGSFDQIGGDIGATDYVDDDGLEANTSYDYELEACNGNGCSARSAAFSATTALGRPISGLSATAQSASEISLSWSAVADATHYKLYRSAAGVGVFARIGDDIIGATDYVDDDGLEANTSYDYELEACNGNGCSARSAAFSATTALGRPISGLSATAQSASEISLSWSAVADATYYKLYRSAAGVGVFARIGDDIIGATDYVDDDGLEANTSYDYELEACNGNGCSARSAAFSATTALGAPTTGLSATAQSASEISLSWSAVADATHYKLYRSAGGGSFDQIGGEIVETAYGDSGLDANTSYDYELEACNGNGCSARSAAFSATTALGRPISGLSATAQSASEISLSWSAVVDATHYKLYRSAAGVGSFDQIGGDIGATDYVDDDGLEANTSYDYELEACNGNGCSARSAAFSATTALGAPTTGLSATAQSASEISLSWSAVADATHYKLYRSAAGVGSFDQIGGEIVETAYGDSGLDANTSYDYELEACNDNGCSARSAAFSATTALGAPTSGLSATTQSASEISISWSAVVDATHYKLYRSAAGVGSFDQIGGDIGATDYVDDDGLEANTSYDYELEACNGNGCSARSAAFSAMTALGMPTAGLTATAQSASEISISWSAVVDATHYKLYRSATGVGSFDQIGGEIVETAYGDSGLEANTSYDYELEACNGNGCSARSAAFSATTALGRPISGLSATAQSASEISLSWSAVADATHYKLYRSAAGVGVFARIGDDIIGATDYVDDDGLEANTSYDYELEACNGNGCSARSAAFSATTALGRPISGLSATAQSASEISLSWSAVADATHYKLYRSAAGVGVFARIGDDIIGATDYVDDDGLEANTSYDYELEACNGNGCSARSAAFSATTALGMPTTGLSATAQSASEISLSWSAVADATHYKLYRSAGGGSFDQIGGEIVETAYGDSGLDANTSYDYELEACNGNGCSARSAAFSATTALGAPTSGLSATTQSASEISISWSAVVDATHYKLYRSAAGVGSFDQIGGDIGATDYVDDDGLEANTSYDYELEACNGNGCSARSAAFSATTALGRPISGLSATAQSASEISLSWSAVADATHYKLYRSAAGVGVFARIGDDIIGATDYVDDDGLEANTSYDYELEACNGNGCSARSAAFSATTALGAPTTGLSATAQSASEISISWSAVADATHYKLYRSDADAGSFAQIGGEIGATDYVDDDGLEANTSYDYELEACNGNGCSARSAAFSAMTALGMPTAGLTATAQSASEISISWSAVVDATHYKLYRSATGVGSFDQIGGEIGATDYVDDNGLEANTSYDYELEACNDNGCSGRSAAFSATTALGMPTSGLSATAQSASEISLSWSAVADATHYKLYRSAGGGSFEQIGGEIVETAYGDSGLEANTSYDYELEACNGNGCSARSAAFSATTALGRPISGLSATAQSASEISLSWSAVADATYYKLYRSAAGVGVFARIGDDIIGATDYVDDDGLEANTSYDYELEACNGNGCSARSAAFSATTALGAPTTGLSATAQSASEISLSWSAVADATHYKLYRSAGGGSFDQIGGEIVETAYGDSGLDANTSYDYELEACNGNGCSARSAAFSATTALGRPISGLSATAQSASEISLSWSAVVDATHYKLYRSAAGVGSFDQIGGDIGATDYVDDDGLEANTSYDYELEACNGNGCSARSAAFSATTALGAPTTGLSATAQSASEISLSWSAVADATHYKLYRSAAGVGSFDQIGGEIVETAYGDSGLDANTSYDYELEACNDNGCSARSAAFSATTALGAPTSGLSATTQSASEISISWSAVVDATHYKLYRSAAGVGSFDQIGGDIGATDYVDDDGLEANTSYDYELEACNGNGCSARSAAFSAMTALGMPTAGLTATAQSASEISISWSAVVDATHYKLYRSATGVGSFDQIGGEIVETAYGDSGLDANTSYDYELEACNGNGCSARSAAFSATTALGRPISGLSATAQSASEISLSWSAVADATHYKLYRSAAGVGVFARIGDDIIGATDYVDDDGLEANTSYDYELEACNGNGCSARSAAFSATTALGRPISGLSATAQSASEISLSWSAVADATYYKLYRSAAGVGVFARIGDDIIGATDYVDDDGLEANTSYDYELEACNGNGCSARSAAFSATTALGAPTTGLSATAQSASEISLSWSAVADATHYKLYRSAGGGSFDQIGGEIVETAYGDSGLDANTSYDYELEACNGNGCSARSAAFSATTALGRPISGLSATAQSASEISLSWSAVVDATHYKLYRSAAGVGSFDQIGGDIGATDYVDDDGLEANTSYDYELEACNGNGCSARSAAFSATTALGAPTTGLSATAQSASEISLSWSAVADATHYKLYRSAAGVGSFDQIGGEIVETAYGDSGLDANTSYDYELEACNDNGCSARSAAFSATTALGAPTSGLSATTQSASEISISWSAVVDATHYKLYRSAAGVGSFDQIGGDIGATDYVDDDGLEANTSYDYELEACNGNGCSARSAAFSAMTALGMPTAGLTATAQSASEISISWSAVVDATHYKLYRSATGVGSFDQIGGEIVETAYGDSGLEANTSYDYELEACNGNGCSARSAAFSATTALGRPISGLSATAQSASEISLSWSAVADATHYKLYRSAAGVGVFARIGDDIIGATDYVDDDGLEANTSYDYELEACNGNGCSARSAAFSATTALGRPISGLSATAQSASEISLSWSAVADATYYKLYRSAAGVGVFARIGDDIIGATDYVDDDGLEANTSYDYELEACNGNGCSARSAAFSATTALGAPTTGLSATAQSASEISLSWSAVADATHYKLYRSAGGGSFDQIGGEIVETAYGDSGLDANTSYDYELEACNGNGCSARSAAFSATTALGRPISGLSATAQSASEISLSWSAVVDATHYKLYRSAAGVGSFDQIGGDIGATDYVDDDGLEANTSYDYELEACNGNGCSARSAAFSATTALGAPTTGLSATAQSASEISLSWSAVADATHYKLYRSAAGVGSFDQIGGEIVETAYGDSGLDANTSYDYELEACNDNGCSARSAAFSATTALGAPTSGLSATTQSASEISISWSAVVDATHYKLYRSAAGVGSFDQIGGDIGATDYVDDDGLEANTSYDYELEACNGNGCSARSAAFSAMTALGMPTAGLTATAQSASEISISWSAVVDATHYKLYRSATGVGSFDQIGGEIVETAYGDSGLDANTSYDYELEACNGNGCSARSAAFSATTALGRPISGLSATAQSASEISLSWSAVADATHYKLYRSAAGVGVFARIGDDIIGATDYVDDDGLEANTSYDYELEACNGNGCSARSAAFSATTALGRPISGLSATAQSASEISLSWSAVADATHYKLYRSAAGVGVFAADRRRHHRRNRLCRRRRFGGEHIVRLRVGGMQRQRMFGSFGGVFGDDGIGGADDGIECDGAKRERNIAQLERGGGCDALQVVSVGGRGIIRSDRRRDCRDGIWR